MEHSEEFIRTLFWVIFASILPHALISNCLKQHYSSWEFPLSEMDIRTKLLNLILKVVMSWWEWTIFTI
jgi:hypothetical protein